MWGAAILNAFAGIRSEPVASDASIVYNVLYYDNNIYWLVLRKYQSRERNFHLRITMTQQNARILVHIPIKNTKFKIPKTITNYSLKSYLQILPYKKNKNNKLAGKHLLK